MHRLSVCVAQAGTSVSGLWRYFSSISSTSKALDWARRQKPKKNFNPKDQFGLLCRGGEILQTEKLDKKGFENPWLTNQKSGEELLEKEVDKARQKWLVDADKFANATVVSVPFRAKLKAERQKRKEMREYMRDISMESLRNIRNAPTDC